VAILSHSAGIIPDPNAEEFIRASMCEGLAMVALGRELDREPADTPCRDTFDETPTWACLPLKYRGDRERREPLQPIFISTCRVGIHSAASDETTHTPAAAGRTAGLPEPIAD
jgi:hypothetical protein